MNGNEIVCRKIGTRISIRQSRHGPITSFGHMAAWGAPFRNITKNGIGNTLVSGGRWKLVLATEWRSDPERVSVFTIGCIDDEIILLKRSNGWASVLNCPGMKRPPYPFSICDRQTMNSGGAHDGRLITLDDLQRMIIDRHLEIS